MTTIPLKDGAPDWERMFKDAAYSLRQCGYTALHPDQIKIGYIAGLERCAQWHDAFCVNDRKQAAAEQTVIAREIFNLTANQHERAARTIRRWMKEQANG